MSVSIEVVDKIRENQWKQGAVLPSSLVDRLNLPKDIQVSSGDMFILITQDCDIVCNSFQNEPFVEFLHAQKVAPCDYDKGCTMGKNPRVYHFESSDRGKEFFKIHSYSKYSLDRKALAEVSPSGRMVNPYELSAVKDWLSRKYLRVALPDEFNKRLSRGLSKVRKVLKSSGKDISAIYIGLSDLGELNESSDYTVVFTLVVPSDVFKGGMTAMREPQKVKSAFEKLIDDSDGINGLVVLASRDKVTLEMVMHYMHWNVYDHLSVSDPGLES